MWIRLGVILDVLAKSTPRERSLTILASRVVQGVRVFDEGAHVEAVAVPLPVGIAGDKGVVDFFVVPNVRPKRS